MPSLLNQKSGPCPTELRTSHTLCAVLPGIEEQTRNYVDEISPKEATLPPLTCGLYCCVLAAEMEENMKNGCPCHCFYGQSIWHTSHHESYSSLTITMTVVPKIKQCHQIPFGCRTTHHCILLVPCVLHRDSNCIKGGSDVEFKYP